MESGMEPGMNDLDVLILRLRGPLMAFGDVAVDEIRPTDILPGLSFMTGLLGNALGWLYTDGLRLQALQDRLLMAARLERSGELLCDCQNARISKAHSLWRGSRGIGWRDFGGPAETTVRRRRYYRADAAVTVAVALSSSDHAPTPDDLEQALFRPSRPLFLGRANCPPSLPVYRGERLQAATLEEALSRTPAMAAPVCLKPSASPWLTEFPARDFVNPLHLKERHDVRDWINGMHAGSRFVLRLEHGGGS